MKNMIETLLVIITMIALFLIVLTSALYADKVITTQQFNVIFIPAVVYVIFMIFKTAGKNNK